MRSLIKRFLKVFRKSNKNKLKSKLHIKQIKDIYHIEGFLNDTNYIVKELWLKSRNGKETITVETTSASNHFSFDLKMADFHNMFEADIDVFDLYLLVETKEETYPIRLGNFKETTMDNNQMFYVQDDSLFMYTTVKGNVSLEVNQKNISTTKFKVNELTVKKKSLNLTGMLNCGHLAVTDSSLILTSRNANEKITVPIRTKLLTENRKNPEINKYSVDVKLDFDTIFSEDKLFEDIYDISLLIRVNDGSEPLHIRLSAPNHKNKKFTSGSRVIKGDKVYSISPYFTVKKFNLSLQMNEFEKDNYFYMQRLLKWSWLIRILNKHKDVWIVGERPYKAQDTGYHFFKYVRENHPDKKVYYVIDQNSPEINNIKQYGNILFYKSKEHIKQTLIANFFIGSHHLDYIYPLRTADFQNKVKGRKVFLQHGVMGTKNTVHFYGKKSPSFETDLFIVSSEYEKSFIINDFGYNEDEVKVTGLSRFDSLFTDNIEGKRQVLIIPTWREWLVSRETFMESEYFERYHKLINNERMHSIAKKYNFEIILCLHPNMQIYTSYFENAPVTVINQGEKDVQDLMKESAMMITDYSSVAFDFSFLEKPVVYYQFDRDKFIGPKGSHIDLDLDLPGEIVTIEDDVVDLIEEYAITNFEMKDNYRKRAFKFLKYKDTEASARIFDAIINYIPTKSKNKVFKTWANSIFKRFRRSRLYFPSMKLFYRIAKKILPVDEKLIIFESGVGKQYADSPRYIYEEILKRDLDYKKVWIYNKNHQFQDANTKRIKRLSPSYYYYLAKAKYWVNNQNFPTYIKKRKETTYVQTWHGTPLKKMLFDINNVQGRSEDYVERVYSASQTWDYLISPSEYASVAFKSAFKYKGNILEIGYPRNDIFYKDEQHDLSKAVKDNLKIPKDKKVILYAPTFRDNQVSKTNKFFFDNPLDLDKMKADLGDEYIVLLRMHVVVSNKITISKDLKGFVYNMSNYPDIQELYLISDILITDYSSVMFDFANTRKPMLFYTFDLEMYRDQLRGFYMDFENEAPGPLVVNTDEIIDSVLNMKDVSNQYEGKYESFFQKYCSLEDGYASKRLVNKIFDK